MEAKKKLDAGKANAETSHWYSHYIFYRLKSIVRVWK